MALPLLRDSADSLERTPPVRAREFLVLGVPVGLDVSCLFGVGLAAWTFADTIMPAVADGRPFGAYWATGLLTAMFLLLSVALHEAAHCLAARRTGLTVRRVELSVFGGVTEFIRPVGLRSLPVRVALAGPLANAGIGVAAALGHVILVEIGADPLSAAALAVLAVANVGLAVLNLVPALPLDGGHILGAAVGRFTGRPGDAIRVARAAGHLVGGGLLAMAVISSAAGDAALALWVGMFGFVIRRHAGGPGPLGRP